MTEQEMRIAIAEACGYLRPHFTPSGSCQANTRRKDDGTYWGTCGVPDYLNDLNAMHEAVKSISYDLQPVYMKNLFYELIAIKGEAGVSDYDKHSADPDVCARAFLKTLNLWIE